jgi:hypothetical protein
VSRSSGASLAPDAHLTWLNKLQATRAFALASLLAALVASVSAALAVANWRSKAAKRAPMALGSWGAMVAALMGSIAVGM